jgi:hypothetical protein
MGIIDAIAKRLSIAFRTPVVFNDLGRTSPVSRRFGLDRGTPVDRHYIERFLGSRRGLVRGRCLEVADDAYCRRFGGNEVTSIDILHANEGEGGATVSGDLSRPETLPKEVADCFICTQTFHVIYDVRSAVMGAERLLRPGGALLATLPGISQISRYDMDRWGDYWRFTSASVQRLFSPVFKGGVEVQAYGNCMAACAFLQGIAVEDLPDKNSLDEPDPDYEVIIGVVARK